MKTISLMIILLLGFAIMIGFQACKSSPASGETADADTEISYPRTPDWHKNANIYEVNLRHYTPEGTFASFQQEIPRLQDMGVDILWFMPIHPISVKNRKEDLGSPYSVADYKDVNPEYGTLEDFRTLVKAIHEAGMHCIIDWVPNHTGWDNPWITEHPEWYTQDESGNIIDPIDYNTGKSWGWTDVADLNYDVPEMRLAMIDAMQFWVKEVGIDGFRVDVAHGIPVDFWAQARDALYKDQEVFLLAEAEVPAIRNNGTFVSDYGWEMHHLLNEIARSQGASRKEGPQLKQGNLAEDTGHQTDRKNALDIDKMLAKKKKDYSQGYAMQFTSNHDENTWSGTEFQRMGEGHRAFAVLTATFDGMPLVYTGQEAAMDQQLAFFSRDTINWGNYEYASFYKALFALKHRNQALWNGEHGGELVKIPTGKDESIYAFEREKNGDKVVVIINLSSQQEAFQLQGASFAGNYTNIFSGGSMDLVANQQFDLPAWEYLVLEKK